MHFISIYSVFQLYNLFLQRDGGVLPKSCHSILKNAYILPQGTIFNESILCWKHSISWSIHWWVNQGTTDFNWILKGKRNFSEVLSPFKWCYVWLVKIRMRKLYFYLFILNFPWNLYIFFKAFGLLVKKLRFLAVIVF